MANNRRKQEPKETVGQFIKRMARELDIDARNLAVLGAVGGCTYELSHDMPLPRDPYLVIRTFAA